MARTNLNHVEPLDPRRMLDATAEGAMASRGDSHLNSTVTYSDLLVLAKNYNYNPSVYLADLGPQFAADFGLAQSMVGGPASATLNKNGKLLIQMSNYNNAHISVRKGVTTVLFNHQSRHGEGGIAEVFERKFTGVRSLQITGSGYDDSIQLSGVTRTTTIRTGGGVDTIRGSDGPSILYGGAGDDEIYGGGGDDTLFGEAGNDRLNGEAGDDRLDGGAGKDKLNGGKGRNKLAGGSGTDYIAVRAGRDKTDRDAKDKLTELA